MKCVQPLLEQATGDEAHAASSRTSKWLKKSNFTFLAAGFLALAVVEMSCAQIAKKVLNKAEHYRKNRSLQNGLCHLVQYVGCLSVFLPKTSVLLEYFWERKGHLRLEIWAEVALTVFVVAYCMCPHSMAAARAMWEMQSDLDQHP